jgi:hypothetical protein
LAATKRGRFVSMIVSSMSTDYGLDPEEHRVLSKARSAAGGYLMPTTFDDQIAAARRTRGVIGAVSPEARPAPRPR